MKDLSDFDGAWTVSAKFTSKGSSLTYLDFQMWESKNQISSAVMTDAHVYYPLAGLMDEISIKVKLNSLFLLGSN